MATLTSMLPLAALFLSSLFLHAALASELMCEDLTADLCAFAIASSGKRCLLETYMYGEEDTVEFQCRTSEVVVERLAGYIESEECVKACGVDRNSFGISSDALLEPLFTAKLCSTECHSGCPNIVDLYFNLAAGEGVFLPDLCKVQRTNPHRATMELLSSGAALSESETLGVSSPAPAPV
ncbi:hypothetical protein SAY87_031853 [Trapa incisa]|uniref:PAR1 protein n=2 Tax=Trapa TaxID=22665 RepID=A0AAN7M381_TRANT|nr:hypothetical protein SAY87_031853 [Trapa incisa]KAK4796784.1 hypothetical protein SAY86_029110 [Trapa natans]